MKFEKPIIIVGAGRSGSTVFHNMFSRHPNLAWLSRLCDIFPANPELNRLFMIALDIRIFEKLLRKIVSPNEVYTFWDFYCKGFSTPFRDLVPTDVTEHNKRQIRAVMTKIITKNRSRILIKITGWPRLGFLSEIFKDAKFIHIMRDGRAVANSLINVDFWWGWRGPWNWRWGTLSPEYEREWNDYNQSFIVLAAIQWKIHMDAIEKAKRYIDERNFMEIKYERLCSEPIEVFKEVTEFCEIEWSEGFENKLTKYPLKLANNKWKQDLNMTQQEDLNNVLSGHLKRYGYN